MSEIIPILGARTLRFWRTLCEQNEAKWWAQMSTSVVLLRRWEGFFFLTGDGSFILCTSHINVPEATQGLFKLWTLRLQAPKF